MTWQARPGEARPGEAGRGEAWQARLGEAGCGEARRGAARQARQRSNRMTKQSPLIKLGQGDYEREYHSVDLDWPTPTWVVALLCAAIGFIAGLCL